MQTSWSCSYLNTRVAPLAAIETRPGQKHAAASIVLSYISFRAIFVACAFDQLAIYLQLDESSQSQTGCTFWHFPIDSTIALCYIVVALSQFLYVPHQLASAFP
jgi:hypothetical protein